MVRLGVVGSHLGGTAETRGTDTVCAWASGRAVSSRWLTFAPAVFSWEPEPTASHLRFPWPPAADWGSCHWVLCLKSVHTGNVKIMRRTLLSPDSNESRTKDGGRWDQGGVALSSVPAPCLPACLLWCWLSCRPASLHSARVLPPSTTCCAALDLVKIFRRLPA